MPLVSKQRRSAGLHKPGSTLVVIVLAMVTRLACGQPAVARDQLFLDQSQEQTEALRKKFPACRKETYRFASQAYCFMVDPKVLERTIANDDPTAGMHVLLLPAEVGRPDIFANKSFSRRLDRHRATGGVEWRGSVHSDQKPAVKIGTALFSVRAGVFVGRITTEKEVFEIRPLQKGLHVIIMADLRKMPPKHPVHKATGSWSHIDQGLPAPESLECTPEIPSEDPKASEITVSVVFEDDAMPAMTDLETMAQGYVGFTYTSMLASLAGAPISPAGASYVHTISKFVTGYQTLGVIVAASSSSPGSIGMLHQWRRADKADVVVIVTNALEVCGYARQAKPDDAEYGFVMVHPDCANVELQVAHEIGHVLGGDHENDVNIVVSPRTEPYARAYIMTSLDKRTIMVETNNGIVEPHFSNPSVCWHDTLPRQPTGVTGTENARAIGERAAIVSNFMH